MSKRGGIYIGVVASNFDREKMGRLGVSIPELTNSLVEVIYTSPFYTRDNGGFLAIPEVGSEILVHKDVGTGDFYYISTILDTPNAISRKGKSDWKVLADKYVYTDRLKPQRQTFTDSFGNGIVISSRTLKDFISAKVDLNTAMGKRISLSDSPLSDMVLIRNEHGDGVVISSAASEVYAERSIERKSKGLQREVSYEGSISTVVVEGGDITLENFSTGANSANGIDGPKSGNINLRSHNSDINIVTKGTSGRIFLNTPKARIQIEADGTVLIESSKDIQLKSAGSINMFAGEDITMKAANIRLEAEETIRFDSDGTVIVNPEIPTQLDKIFVIEPAASPIFFKSLAAVTPTPISSPVTPGKTDYNE